VEDRISGLKDKINIKGKKTRIHRQKDSSIMKQIHEKYVSQSKDQTCESRASKKERCKPDVYVIYSAK
jgi:hypothetical protein